jgi:hypothetical protein
MDQLDFTKALQYLKVELKYYNYLLLFTSYEAFLFLYQLTFLNAVIQANKFCLVKQTQHIHIIYSLYVSMHPSAVISR